MRLRQRFPIFRKSEPKSYTAKKEDSPNIFTFSYAYFQNIL
jgi:hypothetical protein